MMGMMPDVFWDLSYRQFTLLFNYHRNRNESKWEHTAYLASVLMNIHRNWKKPWITKERLMGKDSDDDYVNYVAAIMLESDEWMEDGWQPEETMDIELNEETKEDFK